MPAEKISVLLAGPGHELVFYQLQPPFLSDPRLMVSGQATTFGVLDQDEKADSNAGQQDQDQKQQHHNTKRLFVQ